MISCRFCRSPLKQTLVDLGATPLANSYLPADDAGAPAREESFPLHVMVCHDCWLAQTTETVDARAIFDHGYAYLSSFSAGWVAHAKCYAEMMRDRFGLSSSSTVFEIASNDGYLLQHFVAMGIPVMGVEPAGHAAELAEAKGVPTRVAFFGESAARELYDEGFRADVIAANNVLAHVPDIRDFVTGFKRLLAETGVATFEFPHLANLVAHVQFDTIYHEHYSYLSLVFVERLMAEVGLEVFDVEELPTHGGSLRVFVGHRGAHGVSGSVAALAERERSMGLASPAGYEGFEKKVQGIVSGLRAFLEKSEAEGASVAGYGAAAKGNTLLNVAGVRRDQIPFVVDLNPEKQGTLLPGSHIPVVGPDMIRERRPDYLLILPWNIADEVMVQQAHIRDWGGRFVTAVPELRVR